MGDRKPTPFRVWVRPAEKKYFKKACQIKINILYYNNVRQRTHS